jgi:hypothetical protein
MSALQCVKCSSSRRIAARRKALSAARPASYIALIRHRPATQEPDMTSTADRLTSRAASFVLAFAMTSLSLLGVDAALASQDGVARLVNTPPALQSIG